MEKNNLIFIKQYNTILDKNFPKPPTLKVIMLLVNQD